MQSKNALAIKNQIRKSNNTGIKFVVKKCIICDNAAGSHEHVFPAALGGRRTNKGIYCTTHNNGFGRHVAELEKQLSMLNAILMVRPDRRDEPKSFVFTDKDGTNLSMVGQNIQTAAPPSIEYLGLESGEKANLKFASPEQFEQWREAQRKSGWDAVVVDSTEVQRHHFASPVHVQLTFGGKEALQAVGYLALTFFAQYFPTEVRQNGFDSFKEFLKLDFSKPEDQHGWKPNLVWWDGRDAKNVISENNFRFGHALVTGISGATNRAYAYISFFSSLNFGIDLGPVEDARENMVRVFIDPKAERAPKDLDATHSDTFSIEIDPAMSDLGEMIRSGSAQTAIKRLFDKISEWHFELFIEKIQDEIRDWAKSQSTDRGDLANNLVEKHSQRVLNLLSEASSGLKTYLTKDKFPKEMLTLLDSIVKPDSSQPNGISIQTNAFLEHAKEAIVKAIKIELSVEHPNSERIALLLGGSLGLAIVTKEILLPILMKSPR